MIIFTLVLIGQRILTKHVKIFYSKYIPEGTDIKYITTFSNSPTKPCIQQLK